MQCARALSWEETHQKLSFAIMRVAFLQRGKTAGCQHKDIELQCARALSCQETQHIDGLFTVERNSTSIEMRSQQGAIHQQASSTRHGVSVRVHQLDVCSHATRPSGWK